MSQYKVVMTGRLMTPALERIKEACEVKLWEKTEAIPREMLFHWVKDAQGLVVTGNVKVNEELLQHAPELKVIVQSAVGYDNIDIEACTRHGILVGNTPGVLVEATADLAFSLLLCSARRIHEGWNFVSAGSWIPGHNIPLGMDLAGKTLGIVGMGQIGVAVAKRARVFGMNVIYYNRNRRADDKETGATYQTFDAVLEQADCIIVLTPLSKETKGLFGRQQFSQMKSTAYFVNMSRGPVVDTDALLHALQTGEIAYAALDVTDPEPLPGYHPY